MEERSIAEEAAKVCIHGGCRGVRYLCKLPELHAPLHNKLNGVVRNVLRPNFANKMSVI